MARMSGYGLGSLLCGGGLLVPSTRVVCRIAASAARPCMLHVLPCRQLPAPQRTPLHYTSSGACTRPSNLVKRLVKAHIKLCHIKLLPSNIIKIRIHKMHSTSNMVNGHERAWSVVTSARDGLKLVKPITRGPAAACCCCALAVNQTWARG